MTKANRKVASLLSTLFLLAPMLLGALPNTIYLGDMDADFDVDGTDLQLAMRSCKKGYTGFSGGCTIKLQRAIYPISTTLLWGDGTGGNSDVLNSVTIEGEGACSIATSPPTIGGGTVLRWDGADNGTMIRVDRGMKGKLKDLCIVGDPDMTAGGSNATYGLYFDGDNGAQIKTTQGFKLDNVHFWGAVSGTPDAGSAAVYITGAGTDPKSAQNDKMVFDHVWTEGWDIGIKQDALQALLNVCRSCQLFAQTSAVYISGGNWHFRDSIGGVRRATGGVVFDLAHQTNAGMQQIVVDNWYYESGFTSCATIFKVGQGYSSGATTFGPTSPLIIRDGYYMNQNTLACTAKFIDAATEGGISVQGVHFNFMGSASNRFSVEVSTRTSQPHTHFDWTDNFVNNFWHGTQGVAFSPVSKAGDVIWRALETDPNGVTFNDLNLDGIKNPAESLSRHRLRFTGKDSSANWIAASNKCVPLRVTDLASACTPYNTSTLGWNAYLFPERGYITDIMCSTSEAPNGYDAGDVMVFKVQGSNSGSQVKTTGSLTLPMNTVVGQFVTATINEQFPISGNQAIRLAVDSLIDTGTAGTNWSPVCEVGILVP